jgi:hypothetical protein
MSSGRAYSELAAPSSVRVSGQQPRTWSPGLEAILALQRAAGNRAVARMLQRAPVKAPAKGGGKTGAKGGIETTEVSPEIARLLTAKGIPFAQEVTFEVLDANGVAVLKGRMDYFFRDPRSGAPIITEAKGIDLEALTPNQRQYIPRFEKDGATIRITSRKGGSAKLQTGDLLKVRGENFVLVGRATLKAFADALEFVTTGGQIKFSFRDAEGLRFFKTEAEFDAFLVTKGMTRTKPPPPAKPPDPRPDPASAKPAPAAERVPAETKPPATTGPAAEEVVLAKHALTGREVVNEIAKSQNLRVRKEGGFATIGGMRAVVLLAAGGFLFIQDVNARGLLAASKDFALNAAALKALGAGSARLGVRTPIGFWAGLGYSLLLGLPDDQGPRYHEHQQRADVAYQFIQEHYPGVLEYVGNEWCLWPFGWPCIEVNSPWKIKDRERYNTIFPAVLKLVENPFELEPVPKPAVAAPPAPKKPPVPAPLDPTKRWPHRGRNAP